MPVGAEEKLHPAQLKPLWELHRRKQFDWQLFLIRCRLDILPNPFRARDLNIFGSQKEFLDEIKQTFGDNLLFSSSEELILYSDTDSVVDDLKTLAEPRGIVLKVEKTRLRLDMANLKFEKANFQTAYPSLDASIEPPLCEICQLHIATRLWPDDYAATPKEEAESVPQGKRSSVRNLFLDSFQTLHANEAGALGGVEPGRLDLGSVWSGLHSTRSDPPTALPWLPSFA